MARRITIADIARYAGVSPATVSLVLNGKYTQGQTARGTAERVWEAARVLGYRGRIRMRPEPGAPAIGLLIADRESFFTTYYGPRLLKGMWHVADEYNAHLFLFSDRMEGQPVTFDYLRKELESRRVNDLVVNVNNNLSESLLDTVEALAIGGTRIVALWRRPKSWFAPCVAPDDENAALLMLSHLFELGHRRVALVATEPDERTLLITERFAAAAREMGVDLAFGEALFENGGKWGVLDDDQAVARLLGCSSPPTAIATLYDGRAVGVTKALGSLGYRVPDDISLIAYGNMPENRPTPYLITMVQSPIEQIGETAVRLLVDPESSYSACCAGPPIRLPVALRVGATTGPASKAGPYSRSRVLRSF